MDIIFASLDSFTGQLIKSSNDKIGFKTYFLDNEDEISFIFSDLKPRLFICHDDFYSKYQSQLAKVDMPACFKVLYSDKRDDFYDKNLPMSLDLFELEELILRVLN